MLITRVVSLASSFSIFACEHVQHREPSHGIITVANILHSINTIVSIAFENRDWRRQRAVLNRQVSGCKVALHGRFVNAEPAFGPWTELHPNKTTCNCGAGSQAG